MGQDSKPRAPTPGADESAGLGEDQPKRRPHRATGKKPPGGKREGAGRPEGSKNALPYGAVAAVKVARLRVPKEASEAEAELADRCQQRIIDVMEEKVSSFVSFAVLTAARTLREEVCGKVADRLVVKDESDVADITDEEWEALSNLQHKVRGG